MFGFRLFSFLSGFMIDVITKYLPFLKFFWRKKMEVETFTCSVCWTQQPVDFSVACTKFDLPDISDDEIETDSSDSETDSDTEMEDTTAPETISKEKISSSEKKEDKEHVSHLFCADCVRAQAANACHGDAPLAKGGIGLCCMENKCDSVILLSSFRSLLSPEILTRLEDRMQHETIINAKIKNLERCIKCNYGQIMKNKAYRKKNLKFKCNECGAQHCRLCKAQWKKIHAGKSCWQFKWVDKARNGWDKEANPDFVDNETAQKLTENLIRTCPKCSLSFVKTHGCNLLKCRCGQAQCYNCRANDIGYDHFCNCSSKKTSKKCCNKCDLFDDVKARERKERNELIGNAKRRYETIAEPNSSGSKHTAAKQRHQPRTSTSESVKKH
jgi:hypothetical protein